ncbi:fibronectin type III-like domain-contianing protein [Tessaracoccus sp.]|uniref:fibronectin type III-like domain-contianing protein n=1 Tax=Tessaracoccus sp. TaxID=1971211 RepID=UPI00261A720D|nr:fibronectin type III-like domain-contianing protein [Tessaracoccus sp.]
MRLAEESVAVDGVLRAKLTLHNVGERPVRETVQAYVSDRVTSVSWADQELKGYLQVDLAAGEEKRVALEIPVRDLAIVDAKGERVVEPGAFELRLGRSSRDPWTQRVAFTVR